MYPHGETVTIIDEHGGFDANGDPITVAPTFTVVNGAAVAPRVGGPGTSSSEIGTSPARNTLIEGYTVYLPAGTPVSHTSIIEWAGTRYTVEGEPGVWQNPKSGRAPGIEVAIRRVTG